jgi:hypothetical protein
VVFSEENFMERRFADRNFDIARLATHIGEFFKKYDFEATKESLENGYRIEATDSSIFKMEGFVAVTIEGNPNELVIRLEQSGAENKRPMPSIFLTTAFGGGYFLLKRLKSEENWMKFQREFWKYVENSIESGNY